jgi:hypothetical protein
MEVLMPRIKHLIWVAAAASPMVALTVAGEPMPKPIPTDIPQPLDHLPPGMAPATDAQLREAMRDVSRNRLPSVEERLARIEQLSAQLQQEAKALRQELRLHPPQTQPIGPAEDERVPSVHFR